MSRQRMPPKKILEKLVGFDGIRFPKGMPSDAILRYIAFPPPPSSFLPPAHGKGGPKIPWGVQAKIRFACQMADLDPVKTVGLPPELSREELKSMLPEDYLASEAPKTEATRLIKYVIFIHMSREQKIQENMRKMDDRIRKWKQERKAAKLASKPDMPF